jgi:hypothetical protein
MTVKAAAVSGLSAPAGHERPLAVITLVVWLCTASIGAYMLRRWVLRGGLRRQQPAGTTGAKEQRLPPGVIVAHFSLALAGLLLWVVFVITGWDVLAWSAAGLLMPAIGLGVCTVTLWTPYPTYPDPFAARAPAIPADGADPAGRADPGGGTVTGPAGADHGRDAGARAHRRGASDPAHR